MADTRNARYDSWEDYYLKKGKEETVRHLSQANLSALDGLPYKYADKPAIFKEKIALFP